MLYFQGEVFDRRDVRHVFGLDPELNFNTKRIVPQINEFILPVDYWNFAKVLRGDEHGKGIFSVIRQEVKDLKKCLRLLDQGVYCLRGRSLNPRSRRRSVLKKALRASGETLAPTLLTAIALALYYSKNGAWGPFDGCCFFGPERYTDGIYANHACVICDVDGGCSITSYAEDEEEYVIENYFTFESYPPARE
jgi:hypothetical protein